MINSSKIISSFDFSTEKIKLTDRQNLSAFLHITAALAYFLAYFIMDVIYYHNHWEAFLIIRSSFIIYCVAIFCLRTKILEKYISPLIIVGYLFACMSITLMTIVSGEGFYSPYFGIIIICNTAIAIMAESTGKEFFLPAIVSLFLHNLLTVLSGVPINFLQMYIVSISLIFSIIMGGLYNIFINNLRKREQATNQKNQYFIKVFAHDVKNKIQTSIIHLSSLKLRNGSDKRIEGLLDDQKHINRMVGNLINVFSETELYLRKEKIQIEEIVEGIKKNWETKFQEKNIRFTMSYDKNDSALVDRQYIELVWENLLSNAYQHTKQDGSIEIDIITKNREVIFSFRNSGEVISEEQQTTLFEKYASPEKHSVYSKGIGLHYSKMMIEKHNGTLGYRVSENQMNEFFIVLPLE